jgi:CRISPR type IV-associated protein Csf1
MALCVFPQNGYLGEYKQVIPVCGIAGYGGFMTVQEFIYNANGRVNEHNVSDIEKCHCALCKKETTKGTLAKKILSGNFTNHDIVSGKYLCEACANIMQSELSTALRRSSFVVYEDEIIYFKQADLAEWIFKEKKLPFVMGVTFSYKKHNAFRCILNYSNEEFYIRQEEKLIEIKKEEARKLYKAMLYLYLTYFTKDNIKQSDYNIALVQKFGLQRFNELEAIIKQYRKTDVFELLIEALPSGKKQEYAKNMKEKEVKVDNHRPRKESNDIVIPNLEQRGLF